MQTELGFSGAELGATVMSLSDLTNLSIETRTHLAVAGQILMNLSPEEMAGAVRRSIDAFMARVQQ